MRQPNVPWLNYLSITLPSILGLAVFIILSAVFYSGSKRENIRARVEFFFLEKALRIAAHDAQYPQKVLTIDLKDQDLLPQELVKHPLLKDAKLSVYAETLEQVLLLNPHATIILYWLNDAHSHHIKTRIQDLLTVIDHHGAHKRVILGMQTRHFQNIPAVLKKRYQIYQGTDCVYDVNLICSVRDDWQDWIWTVLFEKLMPHPGQWVVSTNLPHYFPNIVLNFPHPRSLQKISLTDLRAMVHDVNQAKNAWHKVKNAELITIGPNLKQKELFNQVSRILQKSYIALSEPRSNLQLYGVSSQQFAALFAQMLIDQATISVAPLWLCLLVAALLTIMLVTILFRVRITISLPCYLGLALLIIAISMLGFRYAYFYIPIFDIEFALFMVMILTLFVKSSINIYHINQTELQKKQIAEQLDLKTNFFSLISHNLNTPIAKFRGIFDVMSLPHLSLPDHWRNQLALCQLYVSIMMLNIRSALQLNKLDNEHKPLTYKKFSENDLQKIIDEYVSPVIKYLTQGFQGILVQAYDKDLSVELPNVEDRMMGQYIAALLSIRLLEAHTAEDPKQIPLVFNENTQQPWVIKIQYDTLLTNSSEQWTAIITYTLFLLKKLVRRYSKVLRLYSKH